MAAADSELLSASPLRPAAGVAATGAPDTGGSNARMRQLFCSCSQPSQDCLYRGLSFTNTELVSALPSCKLKSQR